MRIIDIVVVLESVAVTLCRAVSCSVASVLMAMLRLVELIAAGFVDLPAHRPSHTQTHTRTHTHTPVFLSSYLFSCYQVADGARCIQVVTCRTVG